MPDQSDVEIALAGAVEAIRVAHGASWAVLRGWPDNAALDRLLAAGRVCVSISPRAGYVTNATRHLGSPETVAAAAPPSLVLTVAGDSVTFGGLPSPGELVGIAADCVERVIRPVPTDMLTSLVEKFATLLPGATGSGSVLTVPSLTAARVMPDAAAEREVRRTRQQFAVIVWAPTPALRDETAALLDAELSDIDFLPGGIRIVLVDGNTTDEAQNASLYRRDLYFEAEYPTTKRRAAPRVVFPAASLRGGQARVVTVSTTIIAP